MNNGSAGLCLSSTYVEKMCSFQWYRLKWRFEVYCLKQSSQWNDLEASSYLDEVADIHVHVIVKFAPPLCFFAPFICQEKIVHVSQFAIAHLNIVPLIAIQLNQVVVSVNRNVSMSVKKYVMSEACWNQVLRMAWTLQ